MLKHQLCNSFSFYEELHIPLQLRQHPPRSSFLSAATLGSRRCTTATTTTPPRPAPKQGKQPRLARPLSRVSESLLDIAQRPSCRQWSLRVTYDGSGVRRGTYWCLLVPAGACWCLPAPTGA